MQIVCVCVCARAKILIMIFPTVPGDRICSIIIITANYRMVLALIANPAHMGSLRETV